MPNSFISMITNKDHPPYIITVMMLIMGSGMTIPFGFVFGYMSNLFPLQENNCASFGQCYIVGEEYVMGYFLAVIATSMSLTPIFLPLTTLLKKFRRVCILVTASVIIFVAFLIPLLISTQISRFSEDTSLNCNFNYQNGFMNRVCYKVGVWWLLMTGFVMLGITLIMYLFYLAISKMRRRTQFAELSNLHEELWFVTCLSDLLLTEIILITLINIGNIGRIYANMWYQ